ncbi:hypothetical protein EV683_10695 [Crenobacter luteus]|uniref:YeeE/YedE family protein n=1 Tax=Crenobacter luteus TaxID=1452487 RepID=UPI00104B612B|nr:YeeE/YedE family protein [Crenobacter luteus]TCP13660.1 hypothetical protein EV683_10695 [Crenobacter luteus]
MAIDWLAFTPASSLAGGALIGVAVVVYLRLAGRIAGISGVVGGLIERAADWPVRLAFVAGLVVAPTLWLAFGGVLPAASGQGWPSLLAAGLLVGFGTRLGSGCTSGHGVCGLARRSPRSLAATLAFMAAGFATVYVTRHLIA